jgi:LacI family transcriptional regulator
MGVGTVSRVLNGGPHVSPSTRARVRAAIRHLDFRPNAQARRISRGRAEMVCFLLSNRDFLHSFHARILQGAETYASELKQHVVFAAVHYSPKTLPGRIQLPPILEERGLVDGLILAGTIYPNFVRRIRTMYISFVAFGNNVFDLDGQHSFDEVSFDGLTGEYQATQYLIESGHRKIAFVGNTSYPWFRERLRGYLRAMQASKLRPISLTGRGPASFVEYGEWAAPNLLAMRSRPTAIVAGNDEIAYGIWRSFRRLGVRIPDEVSMVGFDDREEAVLIDPPLSTVRVPTEQIGRDLVRVLLERLHEPGLRVAKQILPTELVLRGTIKRL